MKKILLADDSITIQKVVELTFSEKGYRVISVGNGDKAIERIQSEEPDLILCDVIMPEKDGYDICEWVKKSEKYNQIPVLLLRGTFEPWDEERAKSVNADGYITKPFESESFIMTVERYLHEKDEMTDVDTQEVQAISDEPEPGEEKKDLTASLAGDIEKIDDEEKEPAELEATEAIEREEEEEPELEEDQTLDMDATLAEEIITGEEREKEEVKEEKEETEKEATEDVRDISLAVGDDDDPLGITGEFPAIGMDGEAMAPEKPAPPPVVSPPPPAPEEEEEMPIDKEEIIRRVTDEVLKKLSDDAIKELAWDIVPELAEGIIKKKIEEIERKVKNLET